MNLEQMASEAPSKAKPATPEQQEQFDTLLGSCRMLIGKTAEEWMGALKIDPVAAAVKMGTQLVRTMAQKYEKAGKPFAPEVLLHVGATLVKDLAQIVNDAGLVPDDQIEGYLQQVMQESLAEYMRMDAEDGLMPKQGAQPAAPAMEPTQMGDDEMMAAELEKIRAQKGTMP